MTFITNALNFPNLTTKSTPTTSDILLISDQAAGGALKQATFGSFPGPTSLITTDNSPTIASFCACMPGMASNIQSSTDLQGYSVQNTYVGLVPFYVGVPWTATKLQIIVKLGFAASTITMGIYNSVNGQASGAPITAGSVASATSNTLVSATISASLSANTLYWAAFQGSATNSNLGVTLAQMNCSSPAIFTYSSSTGTWTQTIAIYPFTYSVGTLPTITPASIINTSFNYIPLMRIV